MWLTLCYGNVTATGKKEKNKWKTHKVEGKSPSCRLPGALCRDACAVQHPAPGMHQDPVSLRGPPAPAPALSLAPCRICPTEGRGPRRAERPLPVPPHPAPICPCHMPASCFLPWAVFTESFWVLPAFKLVCALPPPHHGYLAQLSKYTGTLWLGRRHRLGHPLAGPTPSSGSLASSPTMGGFLLHIRSLVM